MAPFGEPFGDDFEIKFDVFFLYLFDNVLRVMLEGFWLHFGGVNYFL